MFKKGIIIPSTYYWGDFLNREQLSIHDKLFIIYNLTMRIEKERLLESQFNDLSINDLHIIHIIYLLNDATISKIAKLTTVSKSALTGNIDKLEKLGYIERIPSKTDRRVTNIVFTSKGKLLSRLHNRELLKFTRSLLKNRTDVEMDELNEELDQLIKHLENKTADKI